MDTSETFQEIYRRQLPMFQPRRHGYAIFLRLLDFDDEAGLHSVAQELAPLPGRGLTFGVRTFF